MRALITPLDFWRTGLTVGSMMVEAQIVISLRLFGMAGGWTMAPGENQRMIDEKVAAMTESGHAVARAMVTGARPAAVMNAALSPMRRRTKSNVRRLTKASLK